MPVRGQALGRAHRRPTGSKLTWLGFCEIHHHNAGAPSRPNKHVGEQEIGLPKRFHLAWFTNFTAGAWDATFTHGGSPWDGKFYVEFAQALERACFDYIMLEDTLMVSEAYRGTAEAALKYGLQVPKHDPVPLAAMIAAATSRLGVVATMSTMAWPPFMLARVSTTIDHIAGGRFGWNIVTSGEDIAAQNFGLDKLPPRELRYAMADEYMDLVYQLFDAWEPDAVVMDRDRGIYADWRKVHSIDFHGEFFTCRGPLNTVPSPQRRPTFIQAGGSPRGRAFAAKHADSVIAPGRDIQGMKEYRDDVRAHAAKFWAQPRRHQDSVAGLSDLWRDHPGSAGGVPTPCHLVGLRRGLACRQRHHVRHRLLAIRSRQAAARPADHQWRAGFARQVPAMGQRQDTATARCRALR